MAFVIGLCTTTNVHADLQTGLDKKYTTSKTDSRVFMQEVNGLSYEEQDIFMLGKSFFTVPWVEAPAATTARDGLGPLFNANTCISCHPKNGRASIFSKQNNISRAYVTRLSIPSNGSKEHQKILEHSGFIAEPTYGAQISINGIHGVAYEAKPILKYKDVLVTYPDGSSVRLKQPLDGIENQLQSLQYGKLDAKVSITNRLAPALIGLGLVEQLSDAQILENEDIYDKDADGISGKANRVYSPEDKTLRVGRYTYKASSATVSHQSAAAASHDMSLTNPLFPNENCTNKQKACLEAPIGDHSRARTPFDLPLERLEAVSFYLKNLKIPNSRITELKGEKLFETIGCVKCHIQSYTLGNGYKIKPFSDFLLHDMGKGLSDGRSEFSATPQEWRTAPLWGIGKYILTLNKKPELLHDGRAKSIEEAILWHAGEATQTKKNFMNLSKIERQRLIDYIKEL